MIRSHKPLIYQSLNARLKLLEALGREVYHNGRFFENPLSYTSIASHLIYYGFTDPVQLSKKVEFRKLGKKERLVSMVSLITNLAQRILLGNALFEEQSHFDLPTATQLDIATRASCQAIYEQFKIHSPVVSSDVQGWEYSITMDNRWRACIKHLLIMGLASYDGFIKPAEGKQKHFYSLIGLYYTLIYRACILPDTGTVVIPPPGQMSSGELVTFSDNSFMRAELSAFISYQLGEIPTFIKTAGDDCIDRLKVNEALIKDKYREYGFVITDVQVQESEFNFCSTVFADGKSYQENITKTFLEYLVGEQTEDQTLSLTIFKDHPQIEIYLSLLDYLGLGDRARLNF